MNKWDRRFLELADAVAAWSKDPSTQVGAVIVRPDRTIASVGFNGFPRGVDDVSERYDTRPTKYAMILHAEANAILSAREPLHGYTCYVSPLHPCPQCAGMLIQAGVKRVVRWNEPHREDWAERMAVAETMLCEAGVTSDVCGIGRSAL